MALSFLCKHKLVDLGNNEIGTESVFVIGLREEPTHKLVFCIVFAQQEADTQERRHIHPPQPTGACIPTDFKFKIKLQIQKSALIWKESPLVLFFVLSLSHLSPTSKIRRSSLIASWHLPHPPPPPPHVLLAPVRGTRGQSPESQTTRNWYGTCTFCWLIVCCRC